MPATDIGQKQGKGRNCENTNIGMMDFATDTEVDELALWVLSYKRYSNC